VGRQPKKKKKKKRIIALNPDYSLLKANAKEPNIAFLRLSSVYDRKWYEKSLDPKDRSVAL